MQTFTDLIPSSIASPFIFNIEAAPADYIDLGKILPTDSAAFNFHAEYRGPNPIKILGFYLTEINPSHYTGTTDPGRDLHSVIEWGTLYNTDELVNTISAIGVSLIQSPLDSAVEITTVRNGIGDSIFNPIPWTGGNSSKIVQPGEAFHCRFLVRAPSDQLKQILEARSFAIQLNISFVEAVHTVIQIRDGAL